MIWHIIIHGLAHLQAWLKPSFSLAPRTQSDLSDTCSKCALLRLQEYIEHTQTHMSSISMNSGRLYASLCALSSSLVRAPNRLSSPPLSLPYQTPLPLPLAQSHPLVLHLLSRAVFSLPPLSLKREYPVPCSSLHLLTSFAFGIMVPRGSKSPGPTAV